MENSYVLFTYQITLTMTHVASQIMHTQMKNHTSLNEAFLFWNNVKNIR